MAVHGLDHVNILTVDIDGTKRFYKTLLGLVEGVPPPLPAGIEAHWLVDATGHPIIHLQRVENANVGNVAGSIHHVALKCDDFDTMRARCEEMGVNFMVNSFESAKFRQLLVTDPNNVLLEMNFTG
ncbi:VOC family protein [Sphingobium sp. HBC34]|uniref:VOC family protein n=1 Tax=Sphingobium cyanobacteriorum TaxID=3063954 RepID=A0ABT8ZRZ5_9SPHN|nr:VOC family protein [Sphingobium sp. HBC34]MDO7836724.1 VOC family protein [Sphingobium sp. HBC34]